MHYFMLDRFTDFSIDNILLHKTVRHTLWLERVSSQTLLPDMDGDDTDVNNGRYARTHTHTHMAGQGSAHYF